MEARVRMPQGIQEVVGTPVKRNREHNRCGQYEAHDPSSELDAIHGW